MAKSAKIEVALAYVDNDTLLAAFVLPGDDKHLKKRSVSEFSRFPIHLSAAEMSMFNALIALAEATEGDSVQFLRTIIERSIRYGQKHPQVPIGDD